MNADIHVRDDVRIDVDVFPEADQREAFATIDLVEIHEAFDVAGDPETIEGGKVTIFLASVVDTDRLITAARYARELLERTSNAEER